MRYECHIIKKIAGIRGTQLEKLNQMKNFITSSNYNLIEQL
jgi:hypothetical protein